MDIDNQKLAQLVDRLQNGDKKAFDEIYVMTQEKAIFTSLKICKNEEDAQDIVQEAYMYLMEKVNDIKNPEAFMSWFNMVVASKTKNMLRKKNPVLFDSNESEEFILDSIEDNDKDFHPSEDYEHTELREEVMELVDDLSEEKRTAIVLFYYDEMTTKQIAESLGINENTVKSRLVQAKKDLAKGVKTLEKKNKSLYGIAPIPLVIWALRSSAKVTGESFTVGGGSAAVLSAIKSSTAGAAAASGTAVAGTAATTATGGVVAKIAGLSVAQKIISGVVVAGIVTGGAVGTKKIVDNKKETAAAEPTAAVQVFSSTEEITEITSTESETTINIPTGTTLLTAVNSNATTVNVTAVQAMAAATGSSAATREVTTARNVVTTKKATTTISKATIDIIVKQSGEQKAMQTVTLNDGEIFTFKDAKDYIKAMGYDTSTAMYEGQLPITAESGKAYSIIIDVE